MLATELVRKQPINGLASGTPSANGSFNSCSTPMAIPNQTRPHMETGSWRGGGSVGNSDLRRGTPEASTPPLEGFMRRRTPLSTPIGGKREEAKVVDSQPGFVVHATLPPASHESDAALVAHVSDQVERRLAAVNISYEHSFYAPPHTPPVAQKPSSNIAEDDLCEFSLNTGLSLEAGDRRVSFVFHTRSWTAAEEGIAAMRNMAFPFNHSATSLESAREKVHSTLVLKNLPFQLQHEELMEELIKLSCKPSYVRYYHDERGAFKGIAFAKYDTHAEAEVGRFQIEQLSVHARKIRVEFKHKQGVRPDSHGRGVPLDQTYEGKSPSVSPALAPTEHIAYTAHDDPTEPGESEIALEKIIAAFAEADDRKELMVPRSDPAYVHIRKLCHRHSLRWSHLAEGTVCTHKRGGASARSTPVHRPSVGTPPPRTPGNGSFGASGAGVVRERPNKLAVKHEDIVHCKGPGEGDVPFPAGRGRPVAAAKKAA